jgi:spermidine synthase
MNVSANDDGWFTEAMLPFADNNIKISIKTTKTLYDKQSDYSLIQIFDTPFFGRILVIDGIINIANATEFIYHEMMVTLPAVYHGSPKKVLIIGGGDGGAARRALEIKTVENVTMVEVDKTVIDACQQYLPEISDGALNNPKVKLIVGDGIDFVKNTNDKYDLIVLDVSDPVPGGPAEYLLTQEFYSDVKKCLNLQGVMLTHCGSLIFQAKKAAHIVNNLKSIFNNVTMHIALEPEFELTEFGFLVCSDNGQPTEIEVKDRFSSLITTSCQYLSPEVYMSSKVLPPYIQRLTGVVNK